MSDAVSVSLRIPPEAAFASPAAHVAQTLAERSGFARRENYRFQLTVEEFCLCLTGLVPADVPLDIVLTGKRHLLRAAFTFKADNLSLGGLNSTTCAVHLDGASPRDLGLLLAATAADRFRIEQAGGNRFHMVAEVDRHYPQRTPVRPSTDPRPPYTLALRPDAARLSQAAALAMGAYPARQCPASFQTPEQFADLVAEDEVACVLALDAAGQTAGLLTWRPCSERALSFCGPFVFTARDSHETVARLLLDGFLETVARGPYVIVLGFRATDALLPGYFEPLGSLQNCLGTTCAQQPVVFRHLHEDGGMAVWCSPKIEPFLCQAYQHLAMPRDILPVEEAPSPSRRESLLGTTLDRQRDQATLRPFLDGQDMAANLATHVLVLREKGFHQVLFSMDLSRPWEAALAGDLLQSGFTPKLVLPHGGQGDVVVWQHEQAC